ncbi:VOC family protein [Streptomyces sp. NPDC005820]|uniref:VOC family protein n=1 Tax=unclassified Streptomyces TaxID=2593676 RepID=UPI00340B1C62
MYFGGLNHAHIKVSDVERSVKFYTEGFGMVVAESGFDGKLVTLTSPGIGDNLTVSQGVPSGLLDFTGDAEPGTSGGVDHIGFALKNVSDLDNAIEALVELGATLVCTLRPNKESAFLRDPDGYVIQI